MCNIYAYLCLCYSLVTICISDSLFTVRILALQNVQTMIRFHNPFALNDLFTRVHRDHFQSYIIITIQVCNNAMEIELTTSTTNSPINVNYTQVIPSMRTTVHE